MPEVERTFPGQEAHEINAQEVAEDVQRRIAELEAKGEGLTEDEAQELEALRQGLEQ